MCAYDLLTHINMQHHDLSLTQVGSHGFKGVRFNHDSRKWQAFYTDAISGKQFQIPGLCFMFFCVCVCVFFCV